MIHTISNASLTVEISDRGAELRSVRRNDGSCEYLWQGDAKYWEDRAPVLFPICSTVYGGKYTYRSQEYQLGIHGFAQYSDFKTKKVGENKLVLTLVSNEETKKVYPFDFKFELTYSLCRNKLTVSAVIKNTGDVILPATFGAHPGFNVPLTEGCDFESYYMEFSEPCEPDKIILSPECFVTGETEKLVLEDGKRLRLRHDLFIPDGIFMSGMASEVTLRSDSDKRAVTVSYEGMPYLGFWQEYSNDTPFICIEPWCAPPTNDGKTTEDIETKKGLFHIETGKSQKISYSIKFE